MPATVSPFFISFDDVEIIPIGGLLDGTDAEQSFSLSFGTSATPVINRPYPRLDAFGNNSSSIPIAVRRQFDTQEEAWAALYRWHETWSLLGKGIFRWGDAYGHERAYRAIITDATATIHAADLICSYTFTLGQPIEE